MDGSDIKSGELLREYLKKYPASEPRDLVKLLFQREFAGGHMIDNAVLCLNVIINELNLTEFCEISQLFENIGFGMSRLNFSAVKGLPPELIAGMFIHTANTTSGNYSDFLSTLNAFKLQYPDFSDYIDEYIKQGCPAVSHSEAYKREYSPHYRVVYSAYESLIPLLLKAFGLLSFGNKRAVLAIDGPCATGKTFTAGLIKGALSLVSNVEIIHTDDFFLPFSRKTPERLDEIGGNIDYERLKCEVIDHLSDDFITYGVFDCKTQKIVETRSINTNGLIIIEGAYSLHPYFGKYYDLLALLSAPLETRLERLRNRETLYNYTQFLHNWIPLEDRYFSALEKSATNCDF